MGWSVVDEDGLRLRRIGLLMKSERCVSGPVVEWLDSWGCSAKFDVASGADATFRDTSLHAQRLSGAPIDHSKLPRRSTRIGKVRVER